MATKMEPSARGYNFAFDPGENKYRNLALQVGGVSKIETMKHVLESRRTQI
jgi:hypothetical protein